MPCAYAWCPQLARVHGHCKKHWYMLPPEIRDEAVMSRGLLARRSVKRKIKAYWDALPRANS